MIYVNRFDSYFHTYKKKDLIFSVVLLKSWFSQVVSSFTTVEVPLVACDLDSIIRTCVSYQNVTSEPVLMLCPFPDNVEVKITSWNIIRFFKCKRTRFWP